MSGQDLSMDVDWSDDLTIPECNQHMLETKTATDVIFVVGEAETRVPAHKYVLTSRNSVFRIMFHGSLAEKGTEITIPDMEPDIFLKLIRFLYTDDVEVDEENVLPILYAARKYNVIKLAEKCSIFLENELDEQNVLGMLEHAITFNETDLQNKCLRFINLNAKVCLYSPEFCLLSKESISKIICSNSLEIGEEEIYECAMRWARAECGRNKMDANPDSLREALGRNLYNIRFPLFNPKVFTEKIVSSKILTPEECLEILCSYHSSKYPLTRFSGEERYNKERVLRCKRFRRDTTHVWRYGSDQYDSIKFKVDKDIRFAGFTVHRSLKEITAKYKIAYTLLLNDTVVLPEDIVQIETKTQTEYDVIIKESVVLTPEDEYELKLQITGPYSVCGKDGQEIVKSNGVTFVFMNGSISAEERTNVQLGQIPTILFQHI